MGVCPILSSFRVAGLVRFLRNCHITFLRDGHSPHFRTRAIFQESVNIRDIVFLKRFSNVLPRFLVHLTGGAVPTESNDISGDKYKLTVVLIAQDGGIYCLSKHLKPLHPDKCETGICLCQYAEQSFLFSMGRAVYPARLYAFTLLFPSSGWSLVSKRLTIIIQHLKPDGKQGPPHIFLRFRHPLLGPAG